MSESVNDGKRDFLKQAAMLGAAAGAGAVGGAVAPQAALAQMLETGIREDSVLAKIRKEGRACASATRRPGRGSTRTPRPASSAASTRMWSTCWPRRSRSRSNGRRSRSRTRRSGLRRGDYDLYGSSLVYTVAARAGGRTTSARCIPRAACCWCHKDNAERFKTAADLNDPNVTFSVTAGAQRGAAHSAAVPGQGEGRSPPPARCRSAPSRCAPSGPTSG